MDLNDERFLDCLYFKDRFNATSFNMQITQLVKSHDIMTFKNAKLIIKVVSRHKYGG